MSAIIDFSILSPLVLAISPTGISVVVGIAEHTHPLSTCCAMFLPRPPSGTGLGYQCGVVGVILISV